jgi:hypothetical protein
MVQVAGHRQARPSPYRKVARVMVDERAPRWKVLTDSIEASSSTSKLDLRNQRNAFLRSETWAEQYVGGYVIFMGARSLCASTTVRRGRGRGRGWLEQKGLCQRGTSVAWQTDPRSPVPLYCCTTVCTVQSKVPRYPNTPCAVPHLVPLYPRPIERSMSASN